MNGVTLELVVTVAELVARLLPGAISLGEQLIDAIRGNGELSEERKAALIARVQTTRAAVAAYEPRPHSGSPSVTEPAPTPKVR